MGTCDVDPIADQTLQVFTLGEPVLVVRRLEMDPGFVVDDPVAFVEELENDKILLISN